MLSRADCADPCAAAENHGQGSLAVRGGSSALMLDGQLSQAHLNLVRSGALGQSSMPPLHTFDEVLRVRVKSAD